ncbi:sigma-70 family RNA polymerase sigma factor [Cellulomonas sp. APG4]|uniref:RNA polymerase sigma factor n=1 Tax=Cellulomonas sp. APG4 TaxID=1538656 RepID=UPI0013798869|nr:sigma-70 family RNA polymerase sigma factor [Cellulomonas sp. APG4]NCT92196.1 sigma-70 family RNA polymerase sigma factor [Cellulomonas sp. APG4]
MRDDAWFDELFRLHATAVHRYFARRAPAADVQDLAADVLATAWRRRDDVPDGAELPWLYRTAGFVLANHRRKGRPTPVEHLPDVADDTDPADLAVADDEVRRALARLSARDRQVLLLNAWEGLDGQQLAEVLGISRGGADAALSRARARLRAAWADDDADDAAADDGPAGRPGTGASATPPTTQAR